MNIKHAIGISINGNNVKAAFMSRIKGRVYVQGLQSITLAAPLESSKKIFPAAWNRLSICMR
ncbi:MAG: hypothetical protein ACE5G1_13485 [bacterium]